MPAFPSWRVLTLAPPTDQWDVHLITHHEDQAREQAGHLTYKGLTVRLQHRRDLHDEWEDMDFVEAAAR